LFFHYYLIKLTIVNFISSYKYTKYRQQNTLIYKILKVFGYGVLFSVVSLLSPQFPYLLLRAYLKKYFSTKTSLRQTSNAIYYLKRKKFIALKNKKFILTRLGYLYLKKLSINDISIPRIPWDKNWRLVSFDVPQYLTPARHVLRKKLKDLGFFHVQKSLFACPYPCEKEISSIAKVLKISEYVFVFTSRRFSNDNKLIKHFSL
jgi:CRISPR-associated endonuclease Cas2